MEIFKLFGSIFIDNEKADKAIDDTEKKGKGLSGTLGSMVGTAAKVGVGIAAGVVAAGSAMIGLATNAGNAADRLLDLNSITGMSTDEIQRWERVTKVAGVSTDAMTNASQKLTKSLDTIINSGGKGAESLKKLGLSVDDVTKMNADQRMDAIAKALSGVEDKTERAKLGTDLLGASWKEIAPIVDLGADAMQKAKDNANIISNDDLNQANNFRIAMDVMKDRVSYLAMELGVKLIPMGQKFFDWVERHMPQIEKAFDITFKVISTVVGVAVTIIDKLFTALGILYNWVEPYFPVIANIIKGAFETVIDISNAVIKTIERVVAGIKQAIETVNNFINAAKSVGTKVTGFITGKTQGLATGGDVYQSGAFTVGENGPETVYLPAGAAVRPNGGPGGVVVNINGANILDDYGVDRLMDRIIDRLAAQGVG